MQRITVTIEDELLALLDARMSRSGATNRSEALRDILRRALRPEAPETAPCIAVVSYTLDLSQRDLGRRVPLGRQARHDRAVATLSVPLDHATAVEVTVIRGRVGEAEGYAHGLFAERGVRHGHLALVPVRPEAETHSHGPGGAHRHDHLRILDGFEAPPREGG